MQAGTLEMKQAVGKALALATIYFPGRIEPNAASIEAWVQILSGQDPRRIERAFVKSFKASPHPPTPADILNALRSEKTEGLPSANDAWYGVLQSFKATPGGGWHIWRYETDREGREVRRYSGESKDDKTGIPYPWAAGLPAFATQAAALAWANNDSRADLVPVQEKGTTLSPLTLQVVETLGGLSEIESSDAARREYLRIQFIKVYNERLGREVEEGLAAPEPEWKEEAAPLIIEEIGAVARTWQRKGGRSDAEPEQARKRLQGRGQ